MQKIKITKNLLAVIYFSFIINCLLNPSGNGNIDLNNDIYVMTYRGNVYGYNWETLSLSSESIIGPHSRKILFSSDGKNVFISTSSNNSILIFDAENNSLIKTIHLSGEPNGMAFIPHLNRLYVSNITKKQIDIIDLGNYQNIENIELVDSPYPLKASQSGDMIYTSTGSGYFIGVSTIDNQIKNSIKLETEYLYNLALVPNDRIAYVSNIIGNTIFIVNLRKYSIEGKISNVTKLPFPDGTINSLAVSPSNEFLYFSDLNSNYIGVIDIKRKRVIKRIVRKNNARGISNIYRQRMESKA